MTTKKQGILWLGYHRYPSKNPRCILEADLETPIWVVQRTEYG